MNHIDPTFGISCKFKSMKSKDKKIMSKSEVRNFIMYYERLTKHMMRDLKNISDFGLFFLV